MFVTRAEEEPEITKATSYFLPIHSSSNQLPQQRTIKLHNASIHSFIKEFIRLQGFQRLLEAKRQAFLNILFFQISTEFASSVKCQTPNSNRLQRYSGFI